MVFWTIGPVLLAVVGINSFYLFRSRHADFRPLLNYQLGKLERRDRTQVLFVGDSSCGNAIDARHLSQLLGIEVTNAALNGSFGYAGSYNVIRRAAAAMPELRVVVVMQTIDLATRPVSWDGYLLTLSQPAAAADLSVREYTRFVEGTLEGLFSFSRLRIALQRFRGVIISPDPEVDYIRQGSPAQRLRTVGISASLVSDQEIFLRKIADFCASRGLTCVYAHGPSFAPVAADSTSFLRSCNAFIRAAGIQRIVGPIGLGVDQVGDTEDHTAPGSKQTITDAYAKLMEPVLAARERRPFHD